MVVAGVCAYELVALARPRSVRLWPPPITQIVRRWPLVGALLIGVEVHHLYLEIVDP